MSNSIVLFGGTFNPIHYGHIKPVLAAAESVSPDKLIYLPCHIPPHKAAPKVTGEHRLAMTKLATSNITAPFPVEVSDYELEAQGTSYTRKTVEYFISQYPSHKLYFLIGMDSLLGFDTWYHWQEIFDYCDLLVMQRPHYQLQTLSDIAPELANRFEAQIHLTHVTELDVSSTQLRSSLTAGAASDLLPQSVLDYIHHNDLY